MFYIYTLTCNKTSQHYIGRTENPKQRMQTHLQTLRTGTHHNANLQEAWNEHGEECFDFVVLLDEPDEDRACVLEDSLILDMHEKGLAFNIGHEYDNLKWNPNKPDIVKRIGDTLREQISSMSREDRKERWSRPGESNPMFGRTHTDEARKKMSDVNVGNTWAKGHELSDDAKKRLSDSAKLRTGGLNPFFGKKHSEVTKAKIRESKARLPKVLPPNTRKVIAGGAEYSSGAEAARVLHVCQGTICFRIKSVHWPDYYYV